MDTTIKRIFQQVPQSEIILLLSRWGKVPLHQLNLRLKKQNLVTEICALAKELGVDIEDVVLLRLYYVIQYPSKRIWKAYRLQGFSGITLSESHFQPDSFKAALKQKLLIYHSCSVSVESSSGALWGVVGAIDGKHEVHFIHFAFSEFVFATHSSQKYVSMVLEKLCRIVGFETVEDLNLESRDPCALAQILLRNASSKIDKTMAQTVDRADSTALRSTCDERVNVCHEGELKRNKEVVDRQFGRKLLPRLQRVDISTDTRFRGRRYVRSVPASTRVQCQTRLVGPNVLEGLRSLAEHQLTHNPLPAFLTNVAMNGKQCLKISEKKDNECSRLSA